MQNQSGTVDFDSWNSSLKWPELKLRRGLTNSDIDKFVIVFLSFIKKEYCEAYVLEDVVAICDI